MKPTGSGSAYNVWVQTAMLSLEKHHPSTYIKAVPPLQLHIWSRSEFSEQLIPGCNSFQAWVFQDIQSGWGMDEAAAKTVTTSNQPEQHIQDALAPLFFKEPNKMSKTSLKLKRWNLKPLLLHLRNADRCFQTKEMILIGISENKCCSMCGWKQHYLHCMCTAVF